jgi:hypothetical protein
MKAVKIVFAGFIALQFVGCASLPPPSKMREETANFTLPKLPEEGKAMVYVVRPDSIGGLIRFNVFVDDQNDSSEVGYTRGSQYIYFSVTPGDHQILSKAENWAEANITAKPGDIIYLQQIPTMGAFIARNSIAKIEEYEGKYHVKTLKLGTLEKSEK